MTDLRRLCIAMAAQAVLLATALATIVEFFPASAQ